MNVSQLMTSITHYLLPSATLEDAAKKMRELNCGFLPVADDAEQSLQGVVTDRDIVVRGIAMGLNPRTTSVDEVRSNRVLYCFEHDDIEHAARCMHQQGVSRLVVLSDANTKQLRGVISLRDAARKPACHGDVIVSHRTSEEPA